MDSGNPMKPTYYFLKGASKEALVAFLAWKGEEAYRVGGEAENGGRVLGLGSSVWGSCSSRGATREGFCVAQMGPSWPGSLT